MDSAFNHAPLWRAEWRDAEGYLIEARLVDGPTARELVYGWRAVAISINVASFQVLPLNDNIAEEGDHAE